MAGKFIAEKGTVNVIGIIHPGETGEAVGSMEILMAKGRYRIDARLSVNGIGDCGE